MPDFASRKLASTSWVLLPMEETMPIPVTTTRLMLASSAFPARNGWRVAIMWGFRRGFSGPDRLRRVVLEQCDLQIVRLIDQLAVCLEPAVRDAEHELGAHHALDVDAVDDFLDVGTHLAG